MHVITYVYLKVTWLLSYAHGSVLKQPKRNEENLNFKYDIMVCNIVKLYQIYSR